MDTLTSEAAFTSETNPQQTRPPKWHSYDLGNHVICVEHRGKWQGYIVERPRLGDWRQEWVAIHKNRMVGRFTSRSGALLGFKRVRKTGAW